MKEFSGSQKNKVNLVYIAGNVHSGSTLLEMLLGSFDEAWGLGEVNTVPWELVEGKESCECGKYPSFCPFWSEVRKKSGGILKPGGYLSLFRESLNGGKLLRPKEINSLFLGHDPPKERLEDFCRVNRDFFRIAKKKAEDVSGRKMRYLVDSSKDPYRLFWLIFCKDINIKIIHLKKDPRAFVYSMTKNERRFLPGLLKTLRMSIRYIVENLLVEKAIKRVPRSECFDLRYRNLASNPEAVLKRISLWLDIPYRENMSKNFRDIERHGLTGNKARYEKKGVVLDEKWKTGLPAYRKNIIKFMTYPWARKYGYFKKTGMKKIITKAVYFLQSVFSKNDRECPYCLKKNFNVVHKKKGMVDICRCKECGLYWTNPIFKFPRFYNRLYRAEGMTTSLVKEKKLDKIIRSSFEGTDKYYTPVLKWLKKKVSGRKFLDFGSSWGYVVNQAGNLGFDAVGVEISKDRAKFGIDHLGVDIRPDVEKFLEKNEKFDVIFTAHTLEHIGHGIKGVFNNFRKLLSDKGILLIEVPRLDSGGDEEKFDVMGAVHPLGFTEDFFLNNLPDEGFEISVHSGYGDIVKDFKDGDLVVICKKI